MSSGLKRGNSDRNEPIITTNEHPSVDPSIWDNPDIDTTEFYKIGSSTSHDDSAYTPGHQFIHKIARRFRLVNRENFPGTPQQHLAQCIAHWFVQGIRGYEDGYVRYTLKLDTDSFMFREKSGCFHFNTINTNMKNIFDNLEAYFNNWTRSERVIPFNAVFNIELLIIRKRNAPVRLRNKRAKVVESLPKEDHISDVSDVDEMYA